MGVDHAMMLFAALVLFACQHGPFCDARTISFDPVTGASSYRVYWKTNAPQPGNPWQPTVDDCPGSPCVIEVRHPSPGNIVFISVIAVDGATEGEH